MRISRAGSGLAVLVTVASLVAAACGSSSGSGGGATNPGGNLGGGNLGGNPGGVPAGGGSCSVNVTGDVTTSWTEQQNQASVLVTYWLTSAQRTAVNLNAGEENFLFNCQSSGGTLSLYSTSGTTSAQFPKGPGNYVIVAGGLLAGGDPGQVDAVVNIGKDTLWKVGAPGTVTVTTLDGHKFAGSFKFTIQKVGDDLQTVVANASISGTFDFNCFTGTCG